MPPTMDPAGLQLVDVVLTNLAVQYRPQGYIYDQLTPSMPVAYDHGVYPVFSRDDFYRDDVESKVSDRAPTPEIDFDFATAPYKIDDYRLKVSITDKERLQAHPALRLEQSKVNFLMDRMTMRRERRLAAILRKTTNGGALSQGGTVVTKWDQAGSDPEGDIKAARKAVYDATGQHVDTLAMSWDVAYALSLNAAIREIVKYTMPGNTILSQGEKMLPAQLHGLNVVVADGTKVNTARKGAAGSLADIWGDSVRLVKRGADNQWGQPSTAYRLRAPVSNVNQAGDGSDTNAGGGFAMVDRWRTPDPPVDHIRAWECVEEKVVAADVAYEIAGVLT